MSVMQRKEEESSDFTALGASAGKHSGELNGSHRYCVFISSLFSHILMQAYLLNFSVMSVVFIMIMLCD